MRKLTLFATLLALMVLPGTVVAQGCMGGGDEEGVSIVGFFQPQIEYKLQDNVDDEFSFTMRRARVAFTGTIPYDIYYYLCMEFSPFLGNPGALDAVITYTRFGPRAKIAMGQFKSPFSLEQNTSCSALHTINRSMVVNNLASPQRDLGLMVFGAPHDMVSYSVAMMNGAGRGERDDNQSKDYLGRVVVSPLDFLSVGGSCRFGKTPAADEEVVDEDERTRYGVELEFKRDNILVQGEYIYGEDVRFSKSPVSGGAPSNGGCGKAGEQAEADDDVQEYSSDREGIFVQALYMTEWNFQPVVKYEYYIYDQNIDNVNRAFRDEIITVGFNYFLNEWTRLQVNYLYACEKIEVMNDRLILQMQVKF